MPQVLQKVKPLAKQEVQPGVQVSQLKVKGLPQNPVRQFNRHLLV